MNYSHALICLGIGLLSLLLIATIGSIASRKLNFKYTYLAILSLLIYISAGYFVSKEYPLSTALLVNFLLGFFDGTAGFKLSVALKANMGLSAEEITKLVNAKTSPLVMIFISLLLAVVGYGLAQI
jgi:hypothetical protein